jgi:hypothetical protein
LTKDIQITRRCPSCGREVSLCVKDLLGSADIGPDDLQALGSEPDPPRIGRVVRALCGCYVFEMSDTALGRLLTSVMAATDGEPVGGESQRADPGPEVGCGGRGED